MDRYDLPGEFFYYDRAVWVMGPTGSGKSTYAKRLQARWPKDTHILECGSFVREMHGPGATAEELTATTYACLDKDPRHFSKLIRNKINVLTRVDRAHFIARCSMAIIVGARNPLDFIDNFEIGKDGIIFLNGFEPKTDFERLGLDAIRKHVEFMVEVNILAKRQVLFLEPNRAAG